MIRGSRRGITRGETVALIAGVLALSLACVIAVWGVMTWLGSAEPVRTVGVPVLSAPVAIALAICGLAWILWGATVRVLRGITALSFLRVFGGAALAYAVWAVCGSLAGMSVGDTWLSPFAVVLAVIWGFASVLMWALLIRRLFTDAVSLRWPWEDSVTDD